MPGAGLFNADKLWKEYRKPQAGLLALSLLQSPLRWNEFRDLVEIDGHTLADYDLTLFRQWAEHVHHVAFSVETAADSALLAARENPYHPIMDYLNGLSWDGEDRFDELARRLGSDDPLSVALLTRWMLAAIARIYQPGCKADGALVLVGAGGAGKSTLFSILAGEFFSDAEIPMGHAGDAREALSRGWIHELAEMTDLSKRTIEEVKSFITRQVDSGRSAYARLSQERPRQCVFGGTTNRAEYLVDLTGNRRWWTINVGSIDLEWLRDNRDELWAEAFDLYNTAVPLAALAHAPAPWAMSRDEFDQLAARNDAALALPVYTMRAEAWGRTSGADPEVGLSMNDVLVSLFALDKNFPKLSMGDQHAIGDGLRRAGWTKRRKGTAGGARPHLWYPPALVVVAGPKPEGFYCDPAEQAEVMSTLPGEGVIEGVIYDEPTEHHVHPVPQ